MAALEGYYEEFPEIEHELDDGGESAYHVMLFGKLILDINEFESVYHMHFDTIFEAGLKAGFEIAQRRQENEAR